MVNLLRPVDKVHAPALKSNSGPATGVDPNAMVCVDLREIGESGEATHHLPLTRVCLLNLPTRFV